MANTIIKKGLLYQCIELMKDKVGLLEKMMNDAQDSANNETKSSAGDKYETGRAMMHMERDKYAQQLSETLFMQKQLEQIDPEKKYNQVAFGTIVKTKLANYFIAISAGRMEYEGKKYYVISPHAPLSKELLRKKAGDKIMFNEQELEILAVY